MNSGSGTLIEQAWGAVGGGDLPPQLSPTGRGGQLHSRLAVEETAMACVGAALLTGAALAESRGDEAPEIGLDRATVAAAVRSEAHFRRRGRAAAAGFAQLSRFWPAADGWVRTHANYPWHRAALLQALDVEGSDEDTVASAIAELPAREVEERVHAAGGVAAALRSPAQWRVHPQERALSRERLVGALTIGEAPPRPRRACALPAQGIRVLDLTRVIAGPVCTRFLGALGADVLRLDPPRLPDLAPGQPADTLLGKRSAFLDFTDADGLAALHELLDRADVVVNGYRPGSLDRYGLAPEELAERHPGLVAVYLSAWGHSGPWAGRRGFDSIVQAACGIAEIESPGGGRPGALPCQLLDHGTGYLAAAAALDGLRRQGTAGGTQVRRLSLARTARWLTSGPLRQSAAESVAADTASPLIELETSAESVSAVAPPGELNGEPLSWPEPASGYGSDPAEWQG